jgi:hypothetical protein
MVRCIHAFTRVVCDQIHTSRNVAQISVPPPPYHGRAVFRPIWGDKDISCHAAAASAEVTTRIATVDLSEIEAGSAASLGDEIERLMDSIRAGTLINPLLHDLGDASLPAPSGSKPARTRERVAGA